MKTIKLISAAIIFASLLATGCTKDYIRIEGNGPVVTQTLLLDEFTGIDIVGVDDVIISYGAEQNVTVKGQSNIISRINTEVRNDTWTIELENGNYGEYELTYYLTLPVLDEVVNTGTGNVFVNDFIPLDYLSVSIVGTGSFYGFPMTVKHCDVDISGSGNVEISVDEKLDVTIEGSGHVFYKGNPVINNHISGSGSVSSMN